MQGARVLPFQHVYNVDGRPLATRGQRRRIIERVAYDGEYVCQQSACIHTLAKRERETTTGAKRVPRRDCIFTHIAIHKEDARRTESRFICARVGSVLI